MGTSSTVSVVVRLPVSSNILRLIFIFLVTPLYRSSSDSGRGRSTVVTSGVGARAERMLSPKEPRMRRPPPDVEDVDDRAPLSRSSHTPPPKAPRRTSFGSLKLKWYE